MPRREGDLTPRWRRRTEQAVLAATTCIALGVIGYCAFCDAHRTIDLSSNPRLVASASPWRSVAANPTPITTSDEPTPGPVRVQNVSASVPRASPGEKPAPARFQLDVNTAGMEEWMMLPGIGPTYAARILELRDREGPFKSHDDLLRVSRIGAKTLERIRPYLLPIAESAAVLTPTARESVLPEPTSP